MASFDYSEVKHYKMYGFIKALFSPLAKAMFKMKFKNPENIPYESEKYILAINHTSAFDPILVALPKSMPPLHFMGKKELFKNPVVAWFLIHMYCFPVDRGNSDKQSMQFAEKIINEGNILAICPEGTRIKDKNGVPQQAKPGIAIFAKNTGASILPAAICCKNKIKFGEQVTVKYGELLSPAELGLDKEECSREEIAAAANRVMEEITKLRNEELGL